MPFDVLPRTTSELPIGGGSRGVAELGAGKRTLTEALPAAPHPVFRSPKAGEGADGVRDAGATFDALTSGASTEVPFRGEMERAFGQDFSGVRSFVGSGASPGLDALGAQAAARGDTVAFGSAPDRRLVAHELTHVVQQRQGGAATPQGKGGLSDPSGAAEREADAVADRVAAGQRVTVGGASDSRSIVRRRMTRRTCRARTRRRRRKPRPAR